MLKVKSIVARAVAPAVALAAVCVFIGGGAAQASTGTSSAPATPAIGVSWHDLSLLNNWQWAGIAGTGHPRWAVRDGIVYLTGSMYESSGSGDLVAKLPRAARPAHALYVEAYAGPGLGLAHITLFIQSNGSITIYHGASATFADAQAFTSLAGITYPAAGGIAAVRARKLHLMNGWVSRQDTWHTGDPSYYVAGGVVYLSGSLHRTSGASATVTRLPVAARPAQNTFLTVYTWRNRAGIVEILRTGYVIAYGPGAKSFTSLAGITFPAAHTAMYKLALTSYWVSDQPAYGTGKPSYAVINGVVHLQGGVFDPSVVGNLIAVLPAGARPAHIQVIIVYTISGAVGCVEVLPNGEVGVFGSTVDGPQAFTSLASVSYPVNS
jgi:hypothetical protein